MNCIRKPAFFFKLFNVNVFPQTSNFPLKPLNDKSSVFLDFFCSLSHSLVLCGITMSMIVLSLFYKLPQYQVFWHLSHDHTLWWNSIEFWNFRFKLLFLVQVLTTPLPYWSIASHSTANVYTFLHYLASVCNPFGQVCHIQSLYETYSHLLYHTSYKGETRQ